MTSANDDVDPSVVAALAGECPLCHWTPACTCEVCESAKINPVHAWGRVKEYWNRCNGCRRPFHTTFHFPGNDNYYNGPS